MGLKENVRFIKNAISQDNSMGYIDEIRKQDGPKQISIENLVFTRDELSNQYIDSINSGSNPESVHITIDRQNREKLKNNVKTVIFEKTK